jgi:hypothetical protein
MGPTAVGVVGGVMLLLLVCGIVSAIRRRRRNVEIWSSAHSLNGKLRMTLQAETLRVHIIYRELIRIVCFEMAQS